MQTWKNITVHLHDWDLKKAAEQLNNLNVLSITIIDKLPQEYSQWYEENKQTTPIHSSSHSLILLADMSEDTEDLLSEIKFILKLEKTPEILCEPGRAIVAESGSTIVRVNLRKKQKLYINDGT